MQDSHKNRVMLVTGASRGIGRAVAIQAARLGYNLCLNYRQSEADASSLLDLVHAQGVEACIVKADVAVEKEVMALYDTLDKTLGKIDVLVNNAGILTPSGQLAEFDEARLNSVMSTNINGSILCAREAVKRMSTERGGSGGSIVNLSSMAARLGSPNEFIDYAASKGAIDSLTIGLAREVAPEGIRVNAVRPGLIDTDIHASAGDADRINRLRESIPLGRVGTADDVANAIIWLASDQASYVTGSFIDISGGR